MNTESRAQRLVDELLMMLSSEVISAGTRLPTEAALAERFRVSRSVVREAIAQLRAAGIVRSRRGQGTFVLAPPNARGGLGLSFGDFSAAAEKLALLEFRISIETESASLAASRHKESALRGIEVAWEQLKAQDRGPADTVEADFAFHLAIARATENPYFGEVIESLGSKMLAIPRERITDPESSFAHINDEHAAILAAIAERDQLGARAAMRAHLVNSIRRLRHSLQGNEQ